MGVDTTDLILIGAIAVGGALAYKGLSGAAEELKHEITEVKEGASEAVSKLQHKVSYLEQNLPAEAAKFAVSQTTDIISELKHEYESTTQVVYEALTKLQKKIESSESAQKLAYGVPPLLLFTIQKQEERLSQLSQALTEIKSKLENKAAILPSPIIIPKIWGFGDFGGTSNTEALNKLAQKLEEAIKYQEALKLQKEENQRRVHAMPIEPVSKAKKAKRISSPTGSELHNIHHYTYKGIDSSNKSAKSKAERKKSSSDWISKTIAPQTLARMKSLIKSYYGGS